MSVHNAPWSRGECATCGQEILLARTRATCGPQSCETCQAHEHADAEWKKRAAEVVAELRACQKRAAIIAEDNDNDPFRLGRESAWGNAADLVAKKLGVES